MDGRCAPRVQTCRKVTAPFARYFHLATETDPNPIDPLQGSFGIKFFNLLDAICLNTAYGGFSLTFCSRVSQIISFSSLILCSSDLAFRALLFQNGRLLPRPRLLDSGKHIASISLSLSDRSTSASTPASGLSPIRIGCCFTASEHVAIFFEQGSHKR